ncbi:MAG: lytic murein transglycosylase B [Burkholderiaceae bacterium]
MLPALAAKPSASASASLSSKLSARPSAKSAKSAKTAESLQANGRSAKQTQPALLYADRPDAMQAADDIAARRDLDPEQVRRTIGQARLLPQITRWVLPPAKGSAKNWNAYRSRFVEPVRIKAGVAFWDANAALLERAQREYGVPPEIIVGILGVETLYGRDTGNFRVIDALATLSFDFPNEHPRARERREFFLRELEQFLSLAQRSGKDPLTYRGSYAGAMGTPQFMPSSWTKYAIDFDGDGQIDLSGSNADVIGSVAHYFKEFGWQTGMPTHYAVHFEPARLDLDALLAPDILPTFGVASFAAKGALLDDAAVQHIGPLALVELQNGNAPPTYVAGTENFYVITRYNWSSYYAMAVIELGQAIAEARQVRSDVGAKASSGS